MHNDEGADANFRWRLVQPTTLRWAHLSPDNAVFHGATGETHLLSPLPSFVVETLDAEAKPTDEICRETAAACETDDDDAWQRKILSILANLEELELIERQTSANV